MKENLKPCVYKLWDHVKWNRVLFVERSGELRIPARLSALGAEPKGNQVLRGRSHRKVGLESVNADPKPGDLSMSRMKMP